MGFERSGGAVNVRYVANCLPGRLALPTRFLMAHSHALLAELAAGDHWRQHPDDAPTDITVVHLHDVDGQDLGLFEVRHELCSVYTAAPLGPLKKTGPVE